MKKIFSILISLLMMCSCGSYTTMSGGKEDVSFVVVVKEDSKSVYEDVELVVDGKSYIVSNVKSIDKIRKVKPISVSPGKHHIRVLYNGAVIVDEQIFVGLQETRKIMLK